MDTRTHIAPWRRPLLLALLAAGILTVADAAAAPFNARVIWAQGDRAYLVARDSVWVSVGSSVRFFDRKKIVASGIIAAIQDTALVVARITSGSLTRVKHLDRIKVDADRASTPARSTLRVGYPSASRVQPFFECRRMELEARGYRADTLGGRSFRLVRVQTSARPQPDTLIVRLFDDAADEEIALERGDLDAAVFWPGEASSHIRETMRWTGAPKPYRSRGVIGVKSTSRGAEAAVASGQVPTQVDEALARLNRDLFRGDLDPIRYAKPDSLTDAAAWSFEVDSSLPGRTSIRRALGQAPRGRAESVLFTYFDEPVQGAGWSGAQRDPVFWLSLVGCPVLSRPELRPYLETIDLSALVNLFDCVTPARKP